MNVVVRERQAEAAEKLMVVDCDIHPNPRTPNDVKQFLPKRWQEHMTTFGSLSREMYSDTIGYPRMSPRLSRAPMPGRRMEARRAPIWISCASSTSTPTASRSAT